MASSGKPSKNFSVPRRVSTLSGVSIPSGIGVVIFIFGGISAEAPPTPVSAIATAAQSNPVVRFIARSPQCSGQRPNSARLGTLSQALHEQARAFVSSDSSREGHWSRRRSAAQFDSVEARNSRGVCSHWLPAVRQKQGSKGPDPTRGLCVSKNPLPSAHRDLRFVDFELPRFLAAVALCRHSFCAKAAELLRA